MDKLDLVVERILTAANGHLIWVAFSGGVDSHVLLHLLATHHASDKSRLRAIHINHGLQELSDEWALHCQQVAEQLGVSFNSISVIVKNVEEVGLEAAAREARYTALAQYVQSGDLVLTAQHQHDQAETLLLQLLRGAGPKGLSAMSTISSLGNARLSRPFLQLKQQCIIDYAKKYNLKWIEDPSNDETQWSRNYIRHKIWPLIEQRWPSASETISRSALHCAQASELMADLAELDIQNMGCQLTQNHLPISKLMSLSPARYNNVLRYVFSAQNLMMPSAVVLDNIIKEVCTASTDSSPLIHAGGSVIRRYRDTLFIESEHHHQHKNQILKIKGNEVLQLDDTHSLDWQITTGKGLKLAVFSKEIVLRYRQGGEKIKLQGHHQHKTLKHLFQEWAVPPWLRDSIPLLFDEDELIAVIGYGFAEGYGVTADEEGYIPTIQLHC